MKKYQIFLLCSLIIGSVSSSANLLKKIEIKGDGCDNQYTAAETIPTRDQFQIPFRFLMNKSDSVSILRKACQFTLPIHVGANEKILIQKIEQKVSYQKKIGTNLDAFKLQAQLEVFFAGKKGQDITLKEVFEKNKPIEDQEKTLSADSALESACGQDLILRGKFSAFAQGHRAMQLSSGDLILKYKVITCP